MGSTGADHPVVERQVRSILTSLGVGDMFPAPIGQEPVIAAGHELGAVLQYNLVGGLARRPLSKHRRRSVAAVVAITLGTDHLVAGPKVGDGSNPTVGHEDRRVRPYAVRTGMTASAVGVDGVAEGHPRLGRDGIDDPLGPDFEELEAAKLAVAGAPGRGVFLEERLLGPGAFIGQPPAELRPSVFGSPSHGFHLNRTHVRCRADGTRARLARHRTA